MQGIPPCPYTIPCSTTLAEKRSSDCGLGSCSATSSVSGMSIDMPHAIISLPQPSFQPKLAAQAHVHIAWDADANAAHAMRDAVEVLPPRHAPPPPPLPRPLDDLLSVSLQTLAGSSEMLGHLVEDRHSISSRQDGELADAVRAASAAPLRSPSQRPLFVIAPLDVLVTRDEATGGKNRFHIIEINGTGIAGITNMVPGVIQSMMKSLSELPLQLQHVRNPIVLVASSGQESYPPVSRTMHEKMLYIEALRKGFEAMGQRAVVTNMTRLEQQPASMPADGPTLILGYMKQFRRYLSLDAEGRLLLFGRQVHAAVNDRFVLNIMHQFNSQVNLREFMGHNVCFAAGADKGVAYGLYNKFFGEPTLGGRHDCMAQSMGFQRAFTRDELVECVQSRLSSEGKPVVIKPQGTGCGHGIEFFFGDESQSEGEGKIDGAISTVASTYDLECGGLPFTVCDFLDTATVEAEGMGHMDGHKFELRIVVYRSGDELCAFPSIAKVARAAFDPKDRHPDKASLINNITTSSKTTCQSGAEFMLPLCCSETLSLLKISEAELVELCTACTAFMRFVVDQVQDEPGTFGLSSDVLPQGVGLLP